MIENKTFRIEKPGRTSGGSLAELISERVGRNALRWYIADVTDDELIVEATLYNDGLSQFERAGEIGYYPGKCAVMHIVPTGVGCSLGGFAGDAAPSTNLLASTADYLITHPNAVNASDFINLESNNIAYADGYSLDLFCQGLVDLHLPYSNKVGLVIEKADDEDLEVVFNVLNTVRAVHGVNITDVVITEKAIGGKCVENNSGAFVGTIDNPEVLFSACEKLIQKGVNALAITSKIGDLPLRNYARHFEGCYPNPIGGAEAVISYLVTNRFKVPAAHAPLINVKQLDLANNVVDARGAGEVVSTSGLACILIGLRKAAQITRRPTSRIRDSISLNNLLAVVTPASSLGGIPAIYTRNYDVPLIAVGDNETILGVTPAKLGLDNVVEVHSYAEAAGVILALNKGISLESISRPLQTLRFQSRAATVSAPKLVRAR
jgi:hypothetical protein